MSKGHCERVKEIGVQVKKVPSVAARADRFTWILNEIKDVIPAFRKKTGQIQNFGLNQSGFCCTGLSVILM